MAVDSLNEWLWHVCIVKLLRYKVTKNRNKETEQRAAEIQRDSENGVRKYKDNKAELQLT